MRRSRTVAAPWSSAVLLAAVLAACGGSSATPVPQTSAPSTATTLPASPSPTSIVSPAGMTPPPAGPATSTFTLAGNASLAGAITNAQIRCVAPTFGGLTIDLYAPGPDPKPTVRVDLSPGKIHVSIITGQGATYAQREFSGAGLTSFDPARGAEFDSTLAEVPSKALPGKIGVVTSIKGRVDCGYQAAGTSTLTITADIPEGHVAAGLDPVSVECMPNAQGDVISVQGITRVGTRQVLAVLTFRSSGYTIAMNVEGAATSRFYNVQAANVVQLVPGGAHVEGDATEPYASANPLSVHLVGDVSCGWTATP